MITIDIDKAKRIGHDIRRALRAAEFQPYDDIIAKRLPGTTEQEAERARQAIRDRYEDVQTRVDSASTPESIKVALGL